jgi:DNA-binding MarR family transcriptional regulator
MTSATRTSDPRTRLAVRTWESLFRVQARIGRALAQTRTWDEVSPREYGVLYELTRHKAGARLSDLQADELLTQPGMSRLVSRLECRGLVKRSADPDDRRAARVSLTAAGREVQRRVGRQHSLEISALMLLPDDDLEDLRRLCAELSERLSSTRPVESEVDA